MGNDVMAAYLHPAEVGHNWHQSMLGTVLGDMAAEQRIAMLVPQGCSSSGHVAARNHVARRFLDDTDCDWLWWTDTDMGWQPDALYRLLAAADPVERPVVGGLCFAWSEVADDGMGGHTFKAIPTVYDFVDVGGDRGLRFRSVADYPADTVLRCAATGSAMIVLHRTALEKVRAEYGDHWYDRIGTPDGHMGEDVSLCARLGAVGIPVHVDTSVRTNHLKAVYVAEEMFTPAGASAASRSPSR